MTTLRIRKLDDNWDEVFGGGQNNFLTGVEAVAQAVKQHLLLFLGEWWDNKEDGLAMWQSILGVMGANKDNIDQLISARILDTNTNGVQLVTKIVKFVSTFASNAYSCTVTVDTIFGTTTIVFPTRGA